MGVNELLVKDKDGTWKVWRDGQWFAAPAPAKTPIEPGLAAPSLPSVSQGQPQPAPLSSSAPFSAEPSKVSPPLATGLPTPAQPPSAPKPAPTAAPSQPPSVIPDYLLRAELSAPISESSEPAPSAPAVKKPLPGPSMSEDDTNKRIEQLTRQVISEVGVSNLDPELRERLGKAVRLRLKEVRDTVDTRDILLKKRAEGGLEFTDQIADEVIGVILKYLPETHKPFTAALEAVPSEMDRNIAELQSDLLSTGVVGTDTAVKDAETFVRQAAEERAEAAPVHEDASGPWAITGAAVSESLQSKPLPQPPSQPSPQFSPQPQPEPTVPPAPAPAPAAKPARPPAITDVHSKPPVVGPLDELKMFTIADFRRLDADPRRATARLKEKIKLLEEESYSKMVDGVKAWRMSPLNQLYLSIGQESLQDGENAADIISRRREAGKDTLTEEEFESLLDLNRKLRF